MGPVELTTLFSTLLQNVSNLRPASSISKYQSLEARRLFHGRGNCYPGYEHINIDYFPPSILITLFKPLPDPTLDSLVNQIKKLPLPSLSGIVVQKRYEKPVHITLLWGELPEKHYLLEEGLVYEINLNKNQNIGFFMDMRNTRRLIRKLAKGKSVLNLFAFTCSLSVAAAAAKADRVVNIDNKGGVLKTGQTNHNINDLSGTKVGFWKNDVFKSIKKASRQAPFDLFIIDPPTFQMRSFNLEKDYPRLLKKFAPLLHPEGEIIATLNSPHKEVTYLENLILEHFPLLSNSTPIPLPSDFPEKDRQTGVKILHFQSQPTA